ncbi:helix-turn-helix domain-containing protein [Yinghuangia sp. YIM S09857]|uniref:helix-turn-helix domain-containing protein n=1 Tax=Yinghuangia sp. YIM S09857 TaxID=3436929 RepID=UPI003F52FFA3
MTLDQGPTMRRRQLGMELRRLRDEQDLTLGQVAKHIGRVASTVSRIETGQAAPRMIHVRKMLDLYGVPDGNERDALLALAKEGQRRGWWSEYDDFLASDFERYLGYEGGAAGMRVYENRVVPGMLQTQDYATAALRAGRTYGDPDEIRRRVELRLRRQQLLRRDDPLALWIVIDESVLRRCFGGPDVMREQLRHIRTTGGLAHVTVQVLPFHAGAHAGIDGPFTIIEFPDPTDPQVVYLEGSAGNLYLEKPRDLRRHNSIFNQLLSAALTREDSQTFIDEIAQEYA